MKAKFCLVRLVIEQDLFFRITLIFFQFFMQKHTRIYPEPLSHEKIYEFSWLLFGTFIHYFIISSNYSVFSNLYFKSLRRNLEKK